MKMASKRWFSPNNLFCIMMFAVLSSSIAIADDSPISYFSAGGSEVLFNSNNPDISLDSELVKIDVYWNYKKAYYKIDALFWLFNEGEKDTIDIGFPMEYRYNFEEYNILWETYFKKGKIDFKGFQKFQELENFQSQVNDKKTKIICKQGTISVSYQVDSSHKSNFIISKEEMARFFDWMGKTYQKSYYGNQFDKSVFTIDSSSFVFNTTAGKAFKVFFIDIMFGYLEIFDLQWLIKRVAVPSHKCIKTRVKYSSSFVDDNKGIAWKYLYGTGRNWKGNIKKASFIIQYNYNFGSGETPVISIGLIRGSENPIDRKPVIRVLPDRKFEYIIYDFEPEETEYIDGGF